MKKAKLRQTDPQSKPLSSSETWKLLDPVVGEDEDVAECTDILQSTLEPDSCSDLIAPVAPSHPRISLDGPKQSSCASTTDMSSWTPKGCSKRKNEDERWNCDDWNHWAKPAKTKLWTAGSAAVWPAASGGYIYRGTGDEGSWTGGGWSMDQPHQWARGPWLAASGDTSSKKGDQGSEKGGGGSVPQPPQWAKYRIAEIDAESAASINQ